MKTKHRWLKILACSLVMFMAITVIPMNQEVYANEADFTPAGTTEDGLQYDYMDDGLIIGGYVGTAKDVVIPAYINSVPVTYISSAFFERKDVKSVVIPNTVHKICDFAFYGSGIESIYIPDSVTRIEDYAFDGCSALATVSYSGTAEEWKKIGLDSTNKPLSNATVTCHVHQWSDAKLVKPARCEEAGEQAYTCACGEVRTEAIPAKKHDYVVVSETPATCEKAGEKVYECNLDPEHTYTVTSNVLPHTEVVDKAQAATCTKTGLTEGKHCSVCQTVLVKQESVPVVAHTYDDDKDASCNVCGATREVEGDGGSSVPEHKHTYEWVVDMKETCGKAGKKHEECTICHVKRYENTRIPAAGEHTYTDVCDMFCNVCSASRTAPHDFQWVTTVKATCKAEGKEQKVCSLCEKTSTTRNTGKGDHVYDNGCDTMCNVCFARRTTSHKYEWVIDAEATCGKAGKKHKECTACHNKTEENTVIAATKKHTYDSNTDATCNVCGSVRKVEGESGTGTGSGTVDGTHTHEYKSYPVTATMYQDGKEVVKCSCGDIKSTTTIKKISKVNLSKTTAVYTGKTIKAPTITVKDSAGKTISSTYYTVTKPTKSLKNVGEYSYNIMFKGKYSGFKTLTFTIKPKAATLSKVTAAKKAVTVKWSKVSSQATGYEIMYATNSKFTKGKKTVKVTSYKTTSKKITKLTSKKTYYVKVRTYKTVDGVKYYSDWSKVKSVKVK